MRALIGQGRAGVVVGILLTACGGGGGGSPVDTGTAPAVDGGGGATPDAGPQPDAGPCGVTLIQGQDTSAPTEGVPRPALATPYVDEHYRLSVARVTDAAQITDHDVPTWVRHEYSRRPAFNADSSRALMISSNGWLRLYDVEAGGTLAFVKTLAPAEPQEPNWHPTDPDQFYVFEAYGGGLTISSHDVTTEQTTLVADLTARVQALFPGATGMWTKQEGRPSDDGRIWCLEVGHDEGGGFTADGFIAYDLVDDQILGSLAVTETPDHISTSPGGTYCVPSWDYPTGTRAYTTDFASFTQLHERSEHSDLARTRGGDEVLVYTAYDGPDAGDVVMVRLSDGAVTPLFPLYGANNSATAMHLSGTAKQRPGWIVVSFYGCSENYGADACDPAVQWFYDKVIAVELAASPRIFNLAHTHYGDAGYFAEAQAVANADLTKVLFASSWESTDEADLASYLIEIPACALP